MRTPGIAQWQKGRVAKTLSMERPPVVTFGRPP